MPPVIRDTHVAIPAGRRFGPMADHLPKPVLARGRIVAARWNAVRALLATTLLPLVGCFYTAEINQRPGIKIVQTSDDLAYRGSNVSLYAEEDDPEGHVVYKQWRAYACTDATLPDNAGCDFAPFETEDGPMLAFVVPSKTADTSAVVQTVRVVLEAQDDFGAIARPNQELLIPIANHAPDLELSMRARYGYVANTALDLFAKVGDSDDGPASTEPLVWTVFSPMNQPGHTLTELAVPDDDPTNYLQFGKRFTPQGIGEWTVEVTATDPLGAETKKSLVINVVPDGAPCLAQWAPITAPAGNALLLTEPTLFRINVVTDDLDPFPTVPGDAELGTTSFSWSIKHGSGSRASVNVTSNQASLDPANYQPGDIVELRVEIEDRNATPINCADASPTCSVISNNACIQRLTWRVEVR